MDDYAASTATTGIISAGGSTSGNIETSGDADWFKVTLVAGTTYQFDLKGSDTGSGTLQQPWLFLYDSAGNQLRSDLNGGGSTGPGPGWNSQLIYTAPSNGDFYLASGPSGTGTGTYTISAITVQNGSTNLLEEASVGVYMAMNGGSPDDNTTINLISFSQQQFNHGSSIGVTDPVLFVWEQDAAEIS
jgi:hypothetical protein